MLLHMTSDLDFRSFLDSHFNLLSIQSKKRFSSKKYKCALHKMKKLALDPIRDIVFPLYSQMGRPANDPAVYFRSFILMQHFDYTSIDRWVETAANDEVLMFLMGTSHVPSVSCHYDFISRVMHDHPSLDELSVAGLFKKKNKNFLKLKRNEKYVNYTENDVRQLRQRYRNGASADSGRMIFTIQSIFNALAVVPSIKMGLIDPDGTFCGDGSAQHISANENGHRVIDSDDPSALTTRYTATGADKGWDSDLGQWYYGFTEYNISQHNSHSGIDLPVFLTLEAASRHDALTSISATAQMLDMNKNIHPKYMCFDSASDSTEMCEFLLNDRNIIPVIDLNRRSKGMFTDNADSKRDYTINENGVPVCREGFEMTFDGYNPGRKRIKYRCPLKCSRKNGRHIESCPVGNCSKSPYGRVVYIPTKDNLRFFGPVPHGSDKFKSIYKDRTCTERINDRILNDYHLYKMGVRNMAKNAFFLIMAGINIHLDAWIRKDGSCQQA